MDEKFPLAAKQKTKMLTKIPLLTGLIFGAIYPLCFWINAPDPLKNNFHKFHVGIANFVTGVTVVLMLFLDIPFPIKITAVIWKICLFTVSYFSWRKISPNPLWLTFPCLLGLATFAMLQNHWFGGGWSMVAIGWLAGFVLCSSLFAMNLGHWYLNVHGLPMDHLLRAVKVFGFFLGLRLIWDLYYLAFGKIFWRGEESHLLTFMLSLEGFLLWIALFFGTVFPLISLYFVIGTLKVKSTQSATGILYVILSSVLIGDFTYKYYLNYYGLPL